MGKENWRAKEDFGSKKERKNKRRGEADCIGENCMQNNSEIRKVLELREDGNVEIGTENVR